MEQLKAVIFDLDGVIVSTDEYHYHGWQRLCDELGIPFDRKKNERLRGVDRMSCVRIILEDFPQRDDSEQEEMATRKNEYYTEMIADLSAADVLPGALKLFDELDENGIKKVVASASKNAIPVLERLGIVDRFDSVVTGYDYAKGKPAPDVFLTAAGRVGIDPKNCIVVEDALAGVQAGKAAGMLVVGLGDAEGVNGADLWAQSLLTVSLGDLLDLMKKGADHDR